jgi:hypothetical protein
MDYEEFLEMEPGEILGHIEQADIALIALLEKIIEEIEVMQVTLRRMQKGK